MSKHRCEYRPLKYPLSVYKHWALNNWYYFTKPALKRKYTQLREEVITWLNRKK